MKKEKPGAKTPIAVFERRLEGHEDWVNSVAVSPDGKWAVSSSYDNTIKIWDIENGECRATLMGHKGMVQSASITPDGKRILSGSNDNTIQVWDAVTGHCLTTLKGHTHFVLAVVPLLNDSKVLSVGAGDDPTLKLWELSGKCLKTLKGHTTAVTSVAVTGDGKRAVSGSYDNTVKYWNLDTGECLTTFNGHTDNVNSVKITPDEQRAVSGSNDKTVKLWELNVGTCIGTLEGHQGKVHSVDISSNGALVASTGFTDQTIRIWDLKSGDCLQVIEQKEHLTPLSVAFTPDNSRLIAGTTSGEIYIYRLTQIPPPTKPTPRYTNAKIVLLGESGVGKSGLAHRLTKDKFIKTDSTHGMKVRRLELPIREKDEFEREALLWDLAGQEDYRLIHQLFLDETALALMLINPQKDDPFIEVGDWLKALGAAIIHGGKGREAVRLLIAARTDVGGTKVSRKKIDQFRKEYGFVDYIETSAKTGDNCSDRLNKNNPSALKQLIAKHIPWNSLPWTSTPPLLRELKNAVTAMIETEETSLLRFPELFQRLKQKLPDETFTDMDVQTAVTLLANHGVVMPFKFGGLVLLKPQVLNGYASAVIRAARAHTDEIGAVSEKEIFDKKIDFTGVNRFKKPDEDLLLRAMVQTFLDKSLCIAEETSSGKQLIFPSQYRRERPISRHPEIFVSYTFTGELATIYTTLVVRLWYSQEFDNKELWQNAAEFTTSKNRTSGLLMERTGDGQGTISVFFDVKVPDELKVIFIEYVHNHLRQYAYEVRRDRRYVCKCGNPIVDYDVVQKRLDAKKDFIVCQLCDEKVKLIDHIEKRIKTDLVANIIFDIDQKVNRELGNQALEQILNGHMMAICGEANQIFRPVTMFDYGIDGEVEFTGSDGKPGGNKIYVQLKSGDSHLRKRKSDRKIIFDVKKPRHLEYWINQPVDVFLVIRDSKENIRWMNVTRYLKERKDKQSRQIVFDGEKLDADAILRLRDIFISETDK